MKPLSAVDSPLPALDPSNGPGTGRLHALDAARAFALLLGVVFHASLSFLPFFMGWAVQDISTSPVVSSFVLVSHSFRMELFFLLAGWLGHVAYHRHGAVRFIRARFWRIIVPFVVGWFLLRPLLVSGWHMGAASLRGDYDFAAALVSGFKSLSVLPAGLFTGSHLWFLYYLVLVTAAVLTLRQIARLFAMDTWIRRKADSVMTRLAGSRWSVPVCAVPVALALYANRSPGWGMPTPDQSLWPHGPALLVFGGFFGFGWLLARLSNPEPLLRVTAGRCLLAGGAILATLLLSRIEADPGHPQRELGRLAYVAMYACMMWSLVLLTLGACWKLCARPHGWIRFLADAAYWAYLVHLPLVVWLQVAVAEIEAHWSLKLGFVAIVATAVCLGSFSLVARVRRSGGERRRLDGSWRQLPAPR